MHFIHLYNFQSRIGTEFRHFFAERFYPVVNGDVTAFKNPTNRAKSKAFKIELKRLPLYSRAFPAMLYSVSEMTKLAAITLPSFYNPIFYAVFRTAFGANSHGMRPPSIVLRPHHNITILN